MLCSTSAKTYAARARMHKSIEHATVSMRAPTFVLNRIRLIDDSVIRVDHRVVALRAEHQKIVNLYR